MIFATRPTSMEIVRMVRSWPASWLARSVGLALLLPTIAASAASAEDVVRFGAPLPITGPLAPEAIKQQQGYDLWAEQANKAGGISVGGKKYKVEIVYA